MTTEARLTTAAVARVLGISEQTVRYQVRIGAIPVASRTPGGHSRFVLEDVQRSLGIGLDAKLGIELPAAGTGTSIGMDEDDLGEFSPGIPRYLASGAGYDESRFDESEPSHPDGRWLIARLMGQPA